MSELVACPACGRNNGAQRTACLYCGAALPITDATAGGKVPTLRPVEEWEKGFSVVLAPLDAPAPAERQIARLAEVARVDEEVARAILASRVHVPVARVPTVGEANLIVSLLEREGLGLWALPDETLELGRATRRARALRFGEHSLDVNILWGDWVSIPRDRILCAVEGHVVSAKVEVLETPRRLEKKRELVESTEFRTEAFLIDVYAEGLADSFRIKAESFDFSCLGVRPAPNLEPNFGRLGSTLASYLGAARYDARYEERFARLLSHAWPVSTKLAARRLLRRHDSRKFSVSQMEQDALAQFDRYSRMQWVMRRA